MHKEEDYVLPFTLPDEDLSRLNRADYFGTLYCQASPEYRFVSFVKHHKGTLSVNQLETIMEACKSKKKIVNKRKVLDEIDDLRQKITDNINDEHTNVQFHCYNRGYRDGMDDILEILCKDPRLSFIKDHIDKNRAKG